MKDPLDEIIRKRYDLEVGAEYVSLAQGYRDCFQEHVDPLEKEVVRLKQALASHGGRMVDMRELAQDLFDALCNAHDRLNGRPNRYPPEFEYETVHTAEESGFNRS